MEKTREQLEQDVVYWENEIRKCQEKLAERARELARVVQEEAQNKNK